MRSVLSFLVAIGHSFISSGVRRRWRAARAQTVRGLALTLSFLISARAIAQSTEKVPPKIPSTPMSPSAPVRDPARVLSREESESEAAYAARIAKLPPLRVGQVVVHCDRYQIGKRNLPGELHLETWAVTYVNSEGTNCHLEIDRDQARALCGRNHMLSVFARFEVVDGEIRPMGFKAVGQDGAWPMKLLEAASLGTRPGQAWTDPTTNIELRWIPAGTFNMGSPANEDGRLRAEGPQHEIRISRGYWMGAYEVTQRQYETVMGVNPALFKRVGANAPVEQVSWEDAQRFIDRLNAKGGSVEYRLPTEAQWEYACRAGTLGPYYADLDSIAWYDNDSEYSTHPVGQKQADAWGLYDMLGNVSEWCQDWLGDYAPGSATDPAGPSSSVVNGRVLRGGSWTDGAEFCRSAFRFSRNPKTQQPYTGFRVVAIPLDQP